MIVLEDRFSRFHCMVAQIHSAKDLADRMSRIHEVLSEPSVDWAKRVEAVIIHTHCLCLCLCLCLSLSLSL